MNQMRMNCVYSYTRSRLRNILDDFIITHKRFDKRTGIFYSDVKA